MIPKSKTVVKKKDVEKINENYCCYFGSPGVTLVVFCRRGDGCCASGRVRESGDGTTERDAITQGGGGLGCCCNIPVKRKMKKVSKTALSIVIVVPSVSIVIAQLVLGI